MSGAPAIIEHKQYARRIRLEEVMRRTGLGRSTVYARMKKDPFPKQARKEDGTSTATWFEDEIDAYIESTRNEPISTVREKRKEPVPTASKPPTREAAAISSYNASRRSSGRKQSSGGHPGRPLEEFSPTGVSIGGLRMVRHSATRKVFIEVGDLSLQDLLTALTEALQITV